jgi:hypothetical protein
MREDFLSGFYEPIGPLNAAPPLKISGIVVNAEMIRKNGAAFCSECWYSGHEHYIKDIKLCRHCPLHFRKYLTHCPNCHTKLYWHAPLYRLCSCKHELISPTCLPEEAKIEQKLLDIFRKEDSKNFTQLVKYLKQLGHRLDLDNSCPLDRCLLSMAFALLEDDMTAVLVELERLRAFYPGIPKRIICAKTALISHPKLRNCVKAFLRKKADNFALETNLLSQSVPPFTLSQAQICAWLKLLQNHRKIIWESYDIKAKKGRYSWSKAITISEHALRMKLCSGFKKTKPMTQGIVTKELQKKLMLSAEAINYATKEGLLTRLLGPDRKMYFALEDTNNFSKKFISVQLLSKQSNISTSQIRDTAKRLKIPPLEFKSSILRLHLLSTQTSLAIIECHRTTSHSKKNKFVIPLSTSLLRHIPTASETWLTTKESGKILGICATLVCRLIKAGLLNGAKQKQIGKGYLINATTINNFKAKYVSTVEAATLLDCKIQDTYKLLTSLGISPVTGPEVDKNIVNYYYRDKVLAHACTAKRLQRERKLGYTIPEVKKTLRITTPSILTMIKTGRLKLVDRKLPRTRLIKKSCVDNFYDNYARSSTLSTWLNLPFARGSLSKVLNRLGIHPISGPNIDGSKTPIYAITDVAKIFPVTSYIKASETQCNRNMPLIHVSTLLEKYDIYRVSFGWLFLTSGFAVPIQVGRITYISQEDASKIEAILDKYCTHAQADRYLGHPQIGSNLVKNKKLDTFYPLIGYRDHPMILKSQLKGYAEKYCST